MSVRQATALLLAVLLALGGCAKAPPNGQVLARVDGIEITRRDVLIELIARGAPADVDTRTVQPDLLDRIIARKLLAEEALRQAIDRSPEFLGEMRRTRESILGAQLMQRLVGRLPPPSSVAVARFVADRRAAFDRRRIFRVDRIEATAEAGDGLARLASADAVADRLAATGRPFERTIVTLDSVALPAAHLTALEAGRPFVSRVGDRLLIDRATAAESRPASPAERTRIAAAILREQASRGLYDRTIRRLRARAQIEYQVGQPAS